MEKQQTQNQSQPKPEKKILGYYLLLQLGIEFAVIIALPLLVFIYGGKWLDAKFHTNFIVIIGILLAIGLSTYLISLKIKEVFKLLR